VFIGIDPGLRNCGICVLEQTSTNERRVIHVDNCDLFDGGPFANVVTNTRRWIESKQTFLDRAHKIVIEDQFVMNGKRKSMKDGTLVDVYSGNANCKNLIMMATTVATMFVSKSRFVKAQTIKKFFGLPCTGSHARNKDLATEYVRRLALPGLSFNRSGPMHNVCDAALLALYAAEKHHTLAAP
jgi:Holliday junction resolvasome RuvABC endonuclease subunit